jgi:predicted transposase YbfD/YdcC
MPYTVKKTFDLILDLGCHFLAQVKRNCRTLWERIALYTALCQPISTCEYYQEEHGRCLTRRVEVYVNHDNQAQIPKGWNGIERLIKVRRWGTRNNKPFEELSFYVLSKPINSASVIAKAIQNHWSIENNLHWTKDVNLGEDDMTMNDKNAVALLVYLNNIALNTLKAKGYKPIKNTFSKFANKVNELINLFDLYT